MRDVTRCEQSLRELNLMWRMIASSAKMNCPQESKLILPTMAAARDGFNRLEEELVTSLVNEKVGNALEEIGTQAQYVIDIVVRNLYERHRTGPQYRKTDRLRQRTLASVSHAGPWHCFFHAGLPRRMDACGRQSQA
jgi:hypothetical protein